MHGVDQSVWVRCEYHALCLHANCHPACHPTLTCLSSELEDTYVNRMHAHLQLPKLPLLVYFNTHNSQQHVNQP
jgi:hypothetical protein